MYYFVNSLINFAVLDYPLFLVLVRLDHVSIDIVSNYKKKKYIQPRYVSTKEHSYFCGGVKHEEDVAMCLSADIPRNRLGASLTIRQLKYIHSTQFFILNRTKIYMQGRVAKQMENI